MRSKLKIAVTSVLTLVLLLLTAPVAPKVRADYVPPFNTVRLGLYTFKSDGNVDQKSFPSNNLENVSGLGYGYEIGYYDDSREFVPIGPRMESTNTVTAMIDKNMTYDRAANAYTEGTGGDVVVGCYHLRLNETFADYDSALAAAAALPDSFVRCQNGSFLVLSGQYISLEQASAASVDAGFDCSIDSGTAYTVVLVETGTNRILFEYDCGTASSLALRPLAPEGVKAQTWHRKYRYYGGFSFQRKTGGDITVVNYVDIEDYVKGVVPWEMSAGWPKEALKAQAIAARTYLMSNIYRHNSEGFDICNTIHCQAYHGTSRADARSDLAVDETRSQYLVYEGTLCQIYYSSSNGGASENVENVWNENLPYLRGVVDPYEKDVAGTKATDYYWKKTYTPSSLASLLRSKVSGLNISDITNVSVTYTELGNVYSITFSDANGRKYTASKSSTRTIIGGQSIRYTVNGLVPGTAQGGSYFVNGGAVLESLDGAWVQGSAGTETLPSGDVYAISGRGEITKLEATGGTVIGGVVNTGVNSDGYYVFSGTGHGHNVGMSQWGAYSMAMYYGKTCQEILEFYYTGVEVVTAPRVGE